MHSENSITAVILGETGSGKSCFIDLFHFWGRESCGEQSNFKNAAKLSVIHKANEAGGSQSGCQIIKPHRYSFHLKFNGRDYSFILLDTPGMGDIKGPKHDDDNLGDILSFVEKTPSVNAIILMLNGSNCRMSPRTHYILQRLYGMCPKTFENNLYLIFSNTQLKANFDWKKEIKVPIRKENVIPLDNLLFSPGGLEYELSNPVQQKKIEKNYEENKAILSMVFQQLIEGGALRPDAYKDLRINRDTLRVRVSGILKAIHDSKGIKEELNKEMKELQNDIKPSLDLLRAKAEKMTETVKITLCETTYHNTHCLTCAKICHEKCGLSYTTHHGHNIFCRCACMNNDICKCCSHDYTTHVHVKFVFDRKIIKESLLTSTELEALISTTTVEEQKQVIIRKLNRRVLEKEQEIDSFKDELQVALRKLKTLCPHYDYKMELRCAIKLLEEAELVKDKQYNEDELKDLKVYFINLIEQFDTAQGS